MLERIPKEKHPSLLGQFVSYEENCYEYDPQVC